MNRREMLATLGVGLAGLSLTDAAVPSASAQTAAGAAPGGPTGATAVTTSGAETGGAVLGYDLVGNAFTLPPLPYAHDALEPSIDAQTMRLHHGIHHQSYVNGLNKALGELARARQSGDYALVKHYSREAAFHGSGHVLHCLFWNQMAPADKGGGGEPTGELGAALRRDFGSMEAFRAHFSAAASNVEGSGWAVLGRESLSGRLVVLQAEKHQNLTVWDVRPLLVLDVWEHAYYLRYQNRRGDYVKAWWEVVNWPYVAKTFAAVVG